jgi:hypothetical protein
MDISLKPLHGIYLLLEQVYEKKYKSDLESIIQLNQTGLKKHLEKFITNDFFELTDIHTLEKLNEDDRQWQKASKNNLQRKVLLGRLLAFRASNHIEMLQMKPLRELISIN